MKASTYYTVKIWGFILTVCVLFAFGFVMVEAFVHNALNLQLFEYTVIGWVLQILWLLFVAALCLITLGSSKELLAWYLERDKHRRIEARVNFYLGKS